MIVCRHSILCFFSFSFLGILVKPNLVTLHELYANPGLLYISSDVH